MNTEIPADVDLAMRKHVERAVRPVRTGRSKKLRMREELFGHLTAIYLEEWEQRPDHQAALHAALERFGEPAALTAELNASLAWIERFDHWDDLINQKWHARFGSRDDSWQQFCLRWAIGLALFNAFVGVLLLFVVLVQYRSSGDASGFSGLWKLLVLLTVTEPPAVLGMRGVLVALCQQRNAARWLVAVVQAFAWTFVEIIACVAFWWSMSGSLPTSTQLVGLIESFLVGLPPFLIFGGWACSVAERNQQKQMPWTSLAIDE